MVREYVGARYVPKFSDLNGGDWDNTYSYESLEIVKYGNDYYTSKKQVPPGVDISNTEYWALTGNYNGAIAHLDEKIDDTNAEVEKVKDLSLNRGKYLLIGDSYLAGAGTAITDGWGHFFKIIRGLDNDTCKIYKSSGAGFVATGSGGKTYNDLLAEAINDITDPEEFQFIIVLGGYNDAAYGESFGDIRTAKTAFLSAAAANFPNALIYLGVIGKDCYQNNTGAQTRKALAEVVIPAYSYETPTAQKQFHFLANLNTCLLYGYMGSLNHPNEQGLEHIANALDAALEGGFYKEGFTTSTLTCPITDSSDNLVLSLKSDQFVSDLSVGNITINFSVNKTFTANQLIQLGTIPFNAIFPHDDTSVCVTAPTLIVHSGTSKVIPITYSLSGDGKLYARFFETNSGGSWETYTGVSRISIYPAHNTIRTIETL